MVCRLIPLPKIFEIFELSLVVESVFQNAFHMVLYNKSETNVKTGVLFKFLQILVF
jgi:hypothetical protein